MTIFPRGMTTGAQLKADDDVSRMFLQRRETPLGTRIAHSTRKGVKVLSLRLSLAD